MARLASRQIAGYYPAPTHLLPSFASLLKWPEPPRTPSFLLDPCAGDGKAILALRDHWRSQWDPEDYSPWQRPVTPSVVACELEAERARTLKAAIDPDLGDVAYHADAFRLHPADEGSARATVLFLNPPYDTDPEYGRLEHRFLVRFTRFLHPGAGMLLFLVPGQALTACIHFLASQFLGLAAYRLPDEDFQRFGQVVVVGRRSSKPLTDSWAASRIRGWAEDPGTLPVLPELAPQPLTVEAHPDSPYHLQLEVGRFDFTAALEAFRPWEGEPVGVDGDVSNLLGAKFETAVPPKPAHIALALSSGMFNGLELQPNDPRRHPPVLAKGVFEREHVTVSERTDEEGNVTGVVEIEQPRLRLTVLRLDTYEFEELSEGSVPTGNDNPGKWNAADLIAHYDRSLADLLGQQFPALHDPTKAAQRIELPALPRKPYRVQSQAIQAALKLLARGRNPMLVAEVGTGKSTMALSVAAALSPEHFEDTAAELERVGLDPRNLPRVEKTLVVCPPHLIDTWQEEAQAVVPAWRVQVVRAPTDLKAPAELYLLSRETAKLGYGREGVAERCPRCGAPVPESPKKNASRRLTCEAIHRRPVNLTARLAETLANLLLPSAPQSPLVRCPVRAPALLAYFDPDAPPRPFNVPRLLDFQETLCGLLVRRAERFEASSPQCYQLTFALEAIATALGSQAQAVETLEQLLAQESLAAPPWLRHTMGSLRRARCQDLTHTVRLTRLTKALEKLYEAGAWHESAPCGEPLYQARRKPRRIPLAEIIQRYHRRDFGLLILDEAHEFAHHSSAQSKAAHRLSGLPGIATLTLTGSLMGGYASSLFTNFWHLSPLFREEFERPERPVFLDRYGYRKTLREPEDDPNTGPRRRGAYTDRDLDDRKVLGEAPGVMPTFILRHLLPTAVLVHKDDLDSELPPLTELPARIEPGGDSRDQALLGEYDRLESKLLQRIRSDRFDPKRAGRLLGALVELPSYLDRATDDLAPFVIRYPESLGGEWVATGKSFPADWKTPKERWLLARLRERLEAGEKVLVFVRHTGTAELPSRLLNLIREITPKVAWLDAGKVTTAKRSAWINRHVIEAGVEILLVNPNAVRTGLNNLVTFSTALWYELDWSATTYRQANGRLHRIGQERPVTIEVPFYGATAQAVAFDLVAKKVGASLQVDGLDLQAALEAAGASGKQSTSVATAMSLGQAVYEALTTGDLTKRFALRTPSASRRKARTAKRPRGNPCQAQLSLL